MTATVLHCLDIGTGTPPLVLVHGFVGSCADWAEVQRPLARTRRVLAVDQRGHGRSPRAGTGEQYTFDLLVDDLVATIRAQADGPVHLIGHSMGGVVALRLALQHPDLIASLVLLDMAPEPAGQIPLGLLRAVTVIGRRAGMPTAARVVRMLMRLPHPPDPVRAAQRRARSAQKFRHLDPTTLVALGRALNTYPSMVGALSTLTVATTVIVGVEDRGLRAAAALTADRIPGATLVVVDGAGHSPQEDQPEMFVAAIEAHLDRATQTALRRRGSGLRA